MSSSTCTVCRYGNTVMVNATALHKPFVARTNANDAMRREHNVVESRHSHNWFCTPRFMQHLNLCRDDNDENDMNNHGITATTQTQTMSSTSSSVPMVESTDALSADSVYDFWWNQLLPAILSSLPLLFQRLSSDFISCTGEVWHWLIGIPPHLSGFLSDYYAEIADPVKLGALWNQTIAYTPPNLAELLLRHFDADQDGHISANEILKGKDIPLAKLIEMAESFEHRAKAVSWSSWQHMWPMLDWKIGLFLWRSCGGLLLVILFASIVPGRLHAICGRVLRWPILGFTYLMISVELVLYTTLRLFIKFLELIFASPKHRSLRKKMDYSKSYSEWFDTAQALDASQGRDVWQNTNADESTCRHYNWIFIRELMGDLRMARDRNDSLLALAVLQQCTRKNVGGVMSEDLFSYTNTGETKQVVEEFIQEVVKTIYWLTEQAMEISPRGLDRRDDESSSQSSDEATAKYEESLKAAVKTERDKMQETLISWATLSFLKGEKRETAKKAEKPSSGPDKNDSGKKFDLKALPKRHRETVKVFLKRARAAYGRTALVLSGGAMMGCYHFGTVKALLEEGVLPHIISGTSAGSVVGAVVCTRNEEELERDLRPEVLVHKLVCFSRSWPDRIKSLSKNGNLFATEDWLDLIRWFTNGDLTFEEAYRKTGRVLCITLSATTKKAPPVLLNYITAPNVVIASAIVASAAVPGFIPPVLLQVKDANGVVRDQAANKDQTYWDGSIEQDIPIAGLAETFNCQFFLAAQANPHIVPFFFNNKGAVGKPSRWSSGVREHSWRGGFLLSALELYLKNDMKSKFVFLRDLEAAVGFTGTLMTQSYEGTITIVPQVKLRDYFILFANPSLHYLKRCFQGGSVAAYQKVAMMKSHYSIAHALDECLATLEDIDGTSGKNRRRRSLVKKRNVEESMRHTGLINDRENSALLSGLDDEYEVGGFDGMECAFSSVTASPKFDDRKV
uniref:PNPLA domain-containing protein n=2 Tax=Leptocylindrus danicus TaxID=163516 RepID=A0A7S2P954_9STRA|mmetsp:Transcript_25230/g.37714  ORF Transcript_25230/g.37714 Transcript_25230/m.37714 type:complete len:965 (+) Transcript_25230:1163-4057(+)